MEGELTRKKSNRGRKSIENNVNEVCRICKVSLRVKYGSLKSCLNLFKFTERQGYNGVLANSLQDIGITVEDRKDASKVVCKPCGRKISSVCETYKLVVKSITPSDIPENANLQKRKSTDVLTPERSSPGNRKAARVKSPGKHGQSRKSLFPSSTYSPQVNNDKVDSNLNIDDLDNSQGCSTKVLIAYPCGNVVVKSKFDDESFRIIKNLLIVHWCVPWKNSKGERMKGEPPNLPFGQIHQVNFFGRPLSKKYGPVYYIWHCLTPIVILADAEAIRSFYADHYSHKRDRDFTCLGSVWKQVLGDCLANSHGREEVKRCRGPFEKYFTANMVTSVLPIIGRECRSFMEKLPKSSPVDLMKEGLSHVTLRVLMQIVYGEEVLQKHFQRILEIGDQLQDTVDLFNIGETKLPFYSKLPTTINQRAQSFNKTWAEFNRFLFKEYEEGRLNSSGDGLFFVMMEHLKCNSLDMTEQELFHSVDEILLLNIDVSFAATSFAITDIARHRDVQEKLRNEIDQSLEGQDPSKFQDLDKRLPYMEMVLKESARMHPAIALSLPERTVKPFTNMAGYQIPQGTPVCVDSYSLNFNESYWKDPDEFKAERFADGTHHVPCSYFRFGMGPRKCLGYRYALAITRIVVASVLQKYTISLGDPVGSPRIKTRGMPFFTPYLCPDVVFTERS